MQSISGICILNRHAKGPIAWRRMPIQVYADDVRVVQLARLESQLAFCLDNANVEPNVQVHLAHTKITSLSRFANLADGTTEFKKILADEIGLVASDGMVVRLAISDVVDAWTNARSNGH